jgi:hypothetical protein
MKTLLITAIGLLAFVLVGCGIPDADFVTNFPVVRNKTQDEIQQNNHVALYTIKCYDKGGRHYWTVKLILPENFAQVNQHLYFSNGTNMFAGSMELETNTKR